MSREESEGNLGVVQVAGVRDVTSSLLNHRERQEGRVPPLPDSLLAANFAIRPRTESALHMLGAPTPAGVTGRRPPAATPLDRIR